MATTTTRTDTTARMRVRRLGWGLGDQMLSSLTNFALAILVARSVSTASLGAFGLSFTTYTVTLGACRALCSEPLSVRYSAVEHDRWKQGAVEATGAGFVLGCLSGVLCAMGALLFSGTLRESLLALAVTMPGLIVQDTWRSAFFSRLRGSQAFMNDLVWAIAQAAFLAFVLVTGAQSTPAFILAWGGAANVGAAFASLQSGHLPKPRGTWRWFKSQRDLGPRYLVEFVARNAAQSGSMYTTAAFAGLGAAGALRAAQVALGPLNILNIGVTAPAITEAVRIQRRSPRRMLRMVTILAVVLVTVFVAWGTGMWFLPDRLGRALMRHAWLSGHPVVPAYTAVMAASGVLTATTVGLRALAASKRSMRARIITGLLALAGATVGAATAGAVGSALGLAAGLGLGSIQWWIQLRLAVEEAERERGTNRTESTRRLL